MTPEQRKLLVDLAWKSASEQVDDAIHAALAKLDAAEAEVARLLAVVDRLPKTADGVPVVPGMDVWFTKPSPHCVAVLHIESDGIIDTGFHGHNYRKCCGDETYSTREAAEAAKGGGA